MMKYNPLIAAKNMFALTSADTEEISCAVFVTILEPTVAVQLLGTNTDQ